jgi:hypothetical protein
MVLPMIFHIVLYYNAKLYSKGVRVPEVYGDEFCVYNPPVGPGRVAGAGPRPAPYAGGPTARLSDPAHGKRGVRTIESTTRAVDGMEPLGIYIARNLGLFCEALAPTPSQLLTIDPSARIP